MSEVKVIKIKRIPKVGYFGITSYPKSVTVLGCEIDGKTGAFKTGLSAEEQEYFEKELNLKPGELGKHSKYWNLFNSEHPIRLQNTKSTEIVLDNPINLLKEKILKASSKVANSEIERTPGAIFYIDNVEAKAKADLESFNYEFEGMGILLKLLPEEKRSALRLFGKTGVDNLSETMLNVELGKKLKEDPKRFLETMSDKDSKTKGLLQEMIEKNILKRKGSYYIHGEDTIGHSTDEAVAWLNDPKHSDIRKVLESRLSKAKKV